MNEGEDREPPEVDRGTTIVRRVPLGASVPVLGIAVGVGYAGGGGGGAAAGGVVGAVCVLVGIVISPRLYQRLAQRRVFGGSERH